MVIVVNRVNRVTHVNHVNHVNHVTVRAWQNDSLFFDSPLNYEGISQAQELRRYLANADDDVKMNPDIQARARHARTHARARAPTTRRGSRAPCAR